MRVEISEKLKPVLSKEGERLQIQVDFSPEEAVLDRYLKHGFGNAYDFDQEDPLSFRSMS